jgi:hypothetical protein
MSQIVIQRLAKMADDLDAKGDHKAADLVDVAIEKLAQVHLAKTADTLSDLKVEWAAKGYFPHGGPFRKPDGETYQKFRHSSGEIEEVMLPRASTQEPSSYRAKPVERTPTKMTPEPQPQAQPSSWGPFQRLVDAIGGNQADDGTLAGYGITTEKLDELIRILETMRMELDTGFGPEEYEDPKEGLSSPPMHEKPMPYDDDPNFPGGFAGMDQADIETM